MEEIYRPPCTLHWKLLVEELRIWGLGFHTWALMGWRAGQEPACQPIKAQVLNPKSSILSSPTSSFKCRVQGRWFTTVNSLQTFPCFLYPKYW